ncbi:HAD family hydrolase [Celeribacter neptunius]|uniref:phosphoglycolate phosphatase n=1 Tax=Celeribacter neptunius TaxID=588602 RepID=A0A1I3ILB6_9RHOB|nr:HAD family hydrolase [Celeribacter neptunius]SFI48712.1 phosphoglycolate phosphatase [Celeribacter neptunius]
MSATSRREITAVLFDKDGTLMDFQSSWGPWAAGVIGRICGPDAGLRRAVSAALGFDHDRQRFALDSPVIAGTPEEAVVVLQPFFPAVSAAEISAWLDPDPAAFRPVPVLRLRETCERLTGQGIRLAVVTNDFESAGADHLSQMGVSDLFETVVGYDSGYGGKPAPGPCLGAAERLGVLPERCLMVGDSLHDLIAGRRAGMRSLAVLTGVAGAAELAPQAQAVLNSIAELPGWLAGEDL